MRYLGSMYIHQIVFLRAPTKVHLVTSVVGWAWCGSSWSFDKFNGWFFYHLFQIDHVKFGWTAELFVGKLLALSWPFVHFCVDLTEPKSRWMSKVNVHLLSKYVACRERRARWKSDIFLASPRFKAQQNNHVFTI